MDNDIRKEHAHTIRQLFAIGLRNRRNPEISGLIAQSETEWKEWALRTLALDGPRRKLP